MSVGDGRGGRGRYLAWCSAALSTVAIAGMGVSVAVADEAAPAEDLPVEMVRLADGNSGITCTTTTEPTTTTTEPTTTEPTTTTPDPTTTTPAATTTTASCPPAKDHDEHWSDEHRDDEHWSGEHRRHVGGHHAPTCRSAPAQQPDPFGGLVGGLAGGLVGGVGGR